MVEKQKKNTILPLAFNINNVSETNSQKLFGVVFNNCLSFEDHLKMIMETVNKTIGLLRKLQNILPRSQLLPIKKIFIRPHLDYVEIIYDQVYNASFHQKLELLQYNACLGIIRAITDTSREKLQKELGSESLQTRHWYRKLSCF